jgi:hypothetical protein
MFQALNSYRTMQIIRFLAGEEVFKTKVSGLDLGPTQPPTQWVAGVLSSGVNSQELECGHSPLHVDELKKKGRCTFTPGYAFVTKIEINFNNSRRKKK